MKTQYLISTINMVVLAIRSTAMARELKSTKILIDSQESLDQLTGPQQVKLHNEYAAEPIKRFKDKTSGAKSLWKLLNSDAVMDVRHTKERKPHIPLTMTKDKVLVKPHRKSNKQYKLLDYFVKNPNKGLTAEELRKVSTYGEKTLPVRISVLTNHHNMNITRDKETGDWTFTPS